MNESIIGFDDDDLNNTLFLLNLSDYGYKLNKSLLKDIIKGNKSQIFIVLLRHNFKVLGQ